MNEAERPAPVLRVQNLSKAFPGVQANEDISFDVQRGEIHCLLGENGAGKSTLAECLYGAYQPDEGTILFKDRPVHIDSPREAISLGIGMVHQHFDLVPPMTVLENIVVGTPSARVVLNMGQAAEKVRKMCETYQVELDLGARIYDLSVGQQQWVEILKALYEGVEFLILDEPTAVLTPQETEKLFAILARMKAEGFSILLITHKLDEVMEVADRITVLRKGRHMATVRTADVTKRDLARLMVGRDVVFRVHKERREAGAPVLELRQIVSRGNGGTREILRGITLEVRRGEMVGLAGVAGNGQRELFETVVGVRRIDKGALILDGSDISHVPPRRRIATGLASVPEDRIGQGLLMDQTVYDNLILGKQYEPFFRKGGLLASKKIMAFTAGKIEEFGIAALSPRQRARTLSGGNLQKLILARELAHQPRCLIASQPTRGLDVGAIEYVHQCLLDMRKEGVGILLISDDLDEIFSLSDRIAVIYQGRLMGVFPAGEVNVEQVGLLMAGTSE